MITSKTKRIGILGWPLEHSLSPVMHNAAFAALQLDYVYVPLPVRPEKLAQAVEGFKAMGFTGVNVTIPHKVAIIPYLDEIDSSAQMVGAVNTVAVRDGKTIGYNTDARGFIQSLLAQQVTVTGKSAVLMGAGGAAKAVVSGLLTSGIASVTIGARSREKAQALTALFPGNANLAGCEWHDPVFIKRLQECDLLINCTPIGMAIHQGEELPVPWSALTPNTVMCDLIYNPPLTKFLAMAQERGHKIVNGAGMLIEQGALAFEIWTGKPAPREIMTEILCKYG